MTEVYKSRVYTDRPAYADFDPPAKFEAIKSIIAKRLVQHPKAICSYSGGADSDIMIDIIEKTRELFALPPVKYVFFNTGLEMQATKDHVKATSEKYSVEIEECRPNIGIVQAARTYGIPFMSKIISRKMQDLQKNDVPMSITEEYENAKNKRDKFAELKRRYPNCGGIILFLCSCNAAGDPQNNSQLGIKSAKYLWDFINESPPQFPNQCEML